MLSLSGGTHFVSMVNSQGEVETVGCPNYGYTTFYKPPKPFMTHFICLLMDKQNKSKMVGGSVNNFSVMLGLRKFVS